jgi:DNA-directed RNA polymerase specialized sigma subunit
VELDDTIPVLGPESEIHDRILGEQFLAVLNEKEKIIVVLLKSGETKLKDIAEHLGYANHSPVSKALTRIARKARQFFDY